jgi:hypothetical protein
VKISLSINSSQAQAQLRRWGGEFRKSVRVAVSKGLLIPLHGRIGKKKFKTMVAELMRGGNAFFVKNKRGQVILMAENIKEHDRVISGPKRRFKKATGVGRLKRGADVPIAVLVPRVKLRSRLDVKSATLAAMPQLAVAVQRAVEALK